MCPNLHPQETADLVTFTEEILENFIFCAVIDLFLTNSPKRYYQTETFFTGLSDFYNLVLKIFKTTFAKSKAKEIMYQDF